MVRIITYPTALACWMSCPSIKSNIIIEDGSGEIRLAGTPLEHPIHLMLNNAKDRKFDSNIQWHVLPGRLPDNSLIQLSESLYIVRPELCFLLAGNDLSIPELVMVADDLCGTFFKNLTEKNELQSREPLTNITKIHDYLYSTSGVKGLKKAKQAMQYALEKSNSPKETEMAAASKLSFYQGGYALFPPELNYRVFLSEEGKMMMDRDFLCCDMVWPEQKVVVEYDSEEFHISKNQFVYDKRRSTALNMSGYKVFNITKDNLKNFGEVEKIFLSLRKALGMRMRPERLAQYTDKRKETVKQIFLARKRLY